MSKPNKTKGLTRHGQPLQPQAKSNVSGNSGRSTRSAQLSRRMPEQFHKARTEETEAKRLAPLIVTTAKKRAAMRRILAQMKGNRGDQQSARTLLALIQLGPLTTHDLRSELDVIAPAPRIFALRRMGHPIVTQWVRQETEAGHLHRFAQYVLLRGPAARGAR